MFKRIFVLVTCLLVGANLFGSVIPSSSDVHKDNFPYQVRVEGDKVLAKHNINLNTYSYAIKQNYEDCLNRAVARLNSICWVQGFLLVDRAKVQDIVEEEVGSFVRFTESMVLSTALDSAVNDEVCDLLHKNGLVKNDVFTKSESEYNSRYKNVKDKLNGLMLNEYRDYVTKQEIEKAVKNEFTVFVARVKQSKISNAQPSNNSNEPSFLDWLFGTGSYATNNSSKPSTTGVSLIYDKIYKSQIDQQVVLIANSVLQEKGYNQDTLPARVVSDYSDAVQKIVLDAKVKMNNYGYEYLTSDEIKNIAKNDLQAVFDKIKFKGESCSICLCDFTSWQELGVLPCGHVFHGDCIRQALDKSGKRCPLCSAFAVKSDIKIEYVPWQ